VRADASPQPLANLDADVRAFALAVGEYCERVAVGAYGTAVNLAVRYLAGAMVSVSVDYDRVAVRARGRPAGIASEADRNTADRLALDLADRPLLLQAFEACSHHLDGSRVSSGAIEMLIIAAHNAAGGFVTDAAAEAA